MKNLVTEKLSYKKYDVVIVGAGPSGSSAANTLASNGLKVCVIDKSYFPRDKLCGGLLTQRSKKIYETVFKREWGLDLVTSSSTIDFNSNGIRLASLNNYSEMYFSMRFDFDNHLVELAKLAGADFLLGTQIANLNFTENSVKIQNNCHIAYKYLIAADGVSSYVGKSLYGASFNVKKIGFGLEVEVPKDHLLNFQNKIEIDFGAAKWGYGWIFPKKKTYTIGVGGIHVMNPSLRNSLDSYLKFKNLDINSYKVKGQYIPFGDYKLIPGKNNILFVGDAAGAVDPITGEGIAYAMETGHSAALAILKATSINDTNAIAFYLPVYENILKSIKAAKFWRYLIFSNIMKRPFSWAFSDASTLQKGYLDILAGKLDYSDLKSLFYLQLKKAFIKLFNFLKGKISSR